LSTVLPLATGCLTSDNTEARSAGPEGTRLPDEEGLDIPRGLVFTQHPGVTDNLLSFLRQLQRQLRSPILIVWDRLNVHRSAWARIHPRNRSIHSAFLPPYAPELNPVEAFWAYLKMNPLANYAPRDVQELFLRAHRHTRDIADDQLLLRSFIKASLLSLRPK
jgi:transposase